MTDRYVATAAGGGNDANPGTLASPWLTIQKAVNTSGVDGDTVYIRAGSYAEGGRVTKRVTIKGYPGDTMPIVTSSTTNLNGEKLGVFEVAVDGVTIDGLWIRNYTANGNNGHGILLQSITTTPSLTVQNCVISGNQAFGVRSYQSHGLIVHDCDIYDNYTGVSIESTQATAGDFGRASQVYGNTIHDNRHLTTKTVSPTTDDTGAAGLWLLRCHGTAGTHILVYDNVFHDNHDWSYDYGYDGIGIEMFGCSYVDIYNNVFHDNPHSFETGTQLATGGTYNGLMIPMTDINVYQNVSYGGSNLPQYDWRPTGTVWKTDVRAATTQNGALSNSYRNGSVIDGVTLATNDRILIKNQTTQTQNGIYTVNATGSPTRATDADTGSELVLAACKVTSGTVNASKHFYQTTPATITIGTSNIVFAEIIPYQSQFNRTGFSIGGLLAAGQTWKIVQNTFYDHHQSCLSFAPLTGNPYGDTISGMDVRDNIFVQSKDVTSWVGVLIGRDLASTTIDYNLYHNLIASGVFLKTWGDYTGTQGSFTSLATIISNTPYEDHGVSGNPLFQDTTQNDFRITASSPAIDVGVTITNYSPTPLSGAGQDIGYYEYQQGPPPPPPPPLTTTVAYSKHWGRRNVIR